MYLDPSTLQRAASESRGWAGNFEEVVERCTRSDGVISSIGMALLGELESEGSKRPASMPKSLSCLTLLAGSICKEALHHGRRRIRYDPLPGACPRKNWKQVLAFVAENYSNDLPLAELANVAGSREQLSLRARVQADDWYDASSIPDQVSGGARQARCWLNLSVPLNRSGTAIRVQPSKSFLSTRLFLPLHRNDSPFVSN